MSRCNHISTSIASLRCQLNLVPSSKLVAISNEYFKLTMMLRKVIQKMFVFGATRENFVYGSMYPFRARDARMAKCKPVHLTEGAEMQR